MPKRTDRPYVRKKADDPSIDPARREVAKRNPKFGGVVGVGPTSKEWRKEMAKTSENRSHLNPDNPNNRWSCNQHFTPTKKLLYVQLIAKYDRPTEAAKKLGLPVQLVNRHLKEDEDFAELVAEARQLYAESVKATVHAYGVEGVLEDVYYQGKVVGKRRVINPKLTELEAKRVDPSYRDNNSVNVSVVAPAVLVAPPTLSLDSWEAQFGGGNVIEGETIEPGTSLPGQSKP